MDSGGKTQNTKLPKKRKPENAKPDAASDTKDEEEEKPHSYSKQARLMKKRAEVAKEGSNNCEILQSLSDTTITGKEGSITCPFGKGNFSVSDNSSDITLKGIDEDFINACKGRNTSLLGKESFSASVDASERIQSDQKTQGCIYLKGSHIGASDTDENIVVGKIPMKECVLSSVTEPTISADNTKERLKASEKITYTVVENAGECTEIKHKESLVGITSLTESPINYSLDSEEEDLKPYMHDWEEDEATEEEIVQNTNKSSDYGINLEKAARPEENEPKPSTSPTEASPNEEAYERFNQMLRMYENYSKNNREDLLPPPTPITKESTAKSEEKGYITQSVVVVTRLKDAKESKDGITHEQLPLSDDEPSCSTAVKKEKPSSPPRTVTSSSGKRATKRSRQEAVQKKVTSTSAPRTLKAAPGHSHTSSTAVEDNIPLVHVYTPPYRAHVTISPAHEITESGPPEYHTLHIQTASEPSLSVMRRPPLYRRIWMVVQDFASLVWICIQVNKDCLFCLVFFIAFIVSASYLTAFFYRILSVNPRTTHPNSEAPKNNPPNSDDFRLSQYIN